MGNGMFSRLDSSIPGEYYDQADMVRRKFAAEQAQKISSNPNFQRRTGVGQQQNPSAAYLADGLSYDVEGLLRAVALKYGMEAASNLMQKLPTMSRQELMNTQRMVELAARESDNMDERERMAYKRAGMQYIGGQYVNPNEK